MIISLRLIALVHLILLLFLMPLFYMSTPIVDYIDTSSRYRQLVQNLHKLDLKLRCFYLLKDYASFGKGGRGCSTMLSPTRIYTLPFTAFRFIGLTS